MNLSEYSKENVTLDDNIKSNYPDFYQQSSQNFQELTEQNVLQHCLKVGDKIPDFTLPNQEGKMVSFDDLIRDKKYLIISFNRGEWCPYCSLELRHLQMKLEDYSQIPANIVAITPRSPEKMQNVLKEKNVHFDVLTDKKYGTTKKFNLVFTLPSYLIPTYKSFGVDEEYLNEKGNYELPVPATYIVDKDRIVRKYFADINYRQRLDPEEILAFLREN